MSAPANSDQPLQELKHDAVPGYMKAFLIAFAVMGIYLLVILISSPGQVDGHGDGAGHGADGAPMGEDH